MRQILLEIERRKFDAYIQIYLYFSIVCFYMSSQGRFLPKRLFAYRASEGL